MAYFMAASRGLPIGVSIFYATDMWVGVGLWILASVGFVSVHTVLWAPGHGWRVAIRYAVAAILMSVPPFGIAGWASPITAAGVLFPGWSWLGLLASFVGLLAMTTRAWPIVSAVFAIAWGLSVTNWAPVSAPAHWAGINTKVQYASAGEFAGYEQQMETMAMVRRAAKGGATRIVLPEDAFGIWTPTAEGLWTRSLQGLNVAVLGGAIIVGNDGYDNVMVSVTAHGSDIVYRERMPVPISMWQPWVPGGAEANFFASPIGKIGGTSVASLICYEQLLIWPIIQSMLFSPDVIVASGNGWWTGSTNIVAIQKASADAWAALFAVPLVVAFNRP